MCNCGHILIRASKEVFCGLDDGYKVCLFCTRVFAGIANYM